LPLFFEKRIFQAKQNPADFLIELIVSFYHDFFQCFFSNQQASKVLLLSRQNRIFSILQSPGHENNRLILTL